MSTRAAFQVFLLLAAAGLALDLRPDPVGRAGSAQDTDRGPRAQNGRRGTVPVFNPVIDCQPTERAALVTQTAAVRRPSYYVVRPFNVHLSMEGQRTLQVHVYDDQGNDVTALARFEVSGDSETLVSVSPSGLVTLLRASAPDEAGRWVGASVGGLFATNFCAVHPLEKDYHLVYREYNAANIGLWAPIELLGQNVEELTLRYDIPTALGYIHADERNLVGATNFADLQAIEVSFGESEAQRACGSSGNPIQIGWNISDGWGGTNCFTGPHWTTFVHEIGHNTTWASRTLGAFMQEIPYSEAMASFVGVVSGTRIPSHPDIFPLSPDACTSFHSDVLNWVASLRSLFDEWQAAGGGFGTLDANIVDGLLLTLTATYGDCFPVRFFFLAHPDFAERLPTPDTPAKRHTLFAAMCSAAAGKDLHDMFLSSFHYPLDEVAYGSFLSALQALPAPGTLSLEAPVDGGTVAPGGQTLRWKIPGGVLSYDVYFGVQNPPALAASNALSPYYVAVGLPPLTTYFWQVVAHHPCSGNITSPVWSFTTGKDPNGPGARFTWAPTHPRPGEIVRFSDCSTGSPTSWWWEFGDGGTSSLRDVDHVYATAAEYPVRLTVTNRVTDDTTSSSVTVAGPAACVASTGRWPDGSTLAVAAQGNLAAYGSGRKLAIADLSDPSHPRTTGSVTFPSAVEAIALAGGYAYVADRAAGVRVVDISNPVSPREASFVKTDNAVSIAVAGRCAYVADGASGLKVIDISNPAAPFPVGSYNPGSYVSGVAVAGGYAFLAAADKGLRVVSTADPTALREVGGLDTPGQTTDVAIAANFAYLADGDAGLRIVDISDPSRPREVGFANTRQAALSVVLLDHFALVADRRGVSVFDVSAPAAPTAVASSDLGGVACDLALTGATLLVADITAVALFNVANPALPTPLANLATAHRAEGVSVVGSHAFVADGMGHLRVLDVSDPARPREIASMPQVGNAVAVTIVGDYAYVYDSWYGLRVFEVSRPNDPQEVSGAPAVWGPATVAGRYAFVSSGEAGLVVVDVGDPTNPTVLSTCDTPGQALSTVVDGKYVYVADGAAGLQFVDASNPVTPVIVATVSTPGPALDLAKLGSHLFVALQSSLLVIDISNPRSPTIVNRLDGVPAATVTVAGTMLYVASPGLLLVLDVADPLVPREVARVSTLEPITRVATSDRFAFVGLGDAGLDVVSTATCCTTAPGAFGLASPADGARGQGTSVVLDWEDSPHATGYDVFLDSTNPPKRMQASAVAASQLEVTLPFGTITYWSVVARNGCGEATSPVRSFTTRCLAPNPPALVAPTDKSRSLGSTVNLAWTDSPAAASYDLYLGTSSPPPLLRTGLRGTSLTVDQLAAGAAYRWQVTAVNQCGSVPSAEGTFTTSSVRVGAALAQPAYALAVQGDYLLLGTVDGLQILSVADAAHPGVVGTLPLPGTPHAIRPAGNYAYVVVDPVGFVLPPRPGGLLVVDISNPNKPLWLGTCDTPGGAFGVALSPPHAFVADATRWVDAAGGAVRVIDVSLPGNPREVANLITTGDPYGVLMSGQRLLVAGGEAGLLILDVADPLRPTALGRCDTPGRALKLASDGRFVFVADREGGLRVIDAVEPRAPVEVGSVATDGLALAVALSGSVVCVGDGGRVRVMDVSQPTKVVEIDSFETGGLVWDMMVVGSRAFVAAGPAGLEILELPAAPIRRVRKHLHGGL